MFSHLSSDDGRGWVHCYEQAEKIYLTGHIREFSFTDLKTFRYIKNNVIY